MKLLLVLFALIAIAYCAPHVYSGTPEQQFQQFKQQHNRAYKSDVEERLRLEIFKRNLVRAQELTKASNGKY